jgi:phenylacetic acid degradation operon negative regulatory protein
VTASSQAAPKRGDGVASGLRDISLRSGPALLLVILGEFVLPAGQPVWSATLMRALGELDVEATAARKAIQRSAEQGTITPMKEGRRVRWAITGEGRTMLNAGGRQVFEFTGMGSNWDGQWLVVNTTVPESNRHLRHRLRSRLTWCGLGSPAPGFWITPHVNRAKDVAQVIADLDLDDQSFSYIGRFGPVGDERRTVEKAWDLTDLQARYADFIERFRVVQADSDQAAFRNRIELVQAWRRFPYLDPALPAPLTAGRWIGVEAARLMHTRRSAWKDRSESYWNRLRAQPVGD